MPILMSAHTTSSSSTEYSPWSSKVMFWFQRANVGDFRVLISRNTEGGYRITSTEDYPSRYVNEQYVDTYDEVCEYIDTLCRSTLMDCDMDYPITHFQYSVPNFPDVVVPIAQLGNETFYTTFCETIDYHLYRE
jgi:hypothetical protein